jgi:hypothetical protein
MPLGRIGQPDDSHNAAWPALFRLISATRLSTLEEKIGDFTVATNREVGVARPMPARR